MTTSLIGIDFGACNLKAAKFVKGNVRPVKLNKNQSGNNATPNVIYYDTDQYIVGKRAKEKSDFKNKVLHIKRKLECENWEQHIPNIDKTLNAQDVAQDIFGWLNETITGQSKEDFEAVITVPVCYTEIQKNRIKAAAEKAGITVSRIITEPFAALFSIDELFDNEGEQVVLIYDFGGSTLDLSLLKIENDGDTVCVTELSSLGKQFGGLTLDEWILEDVFCNKYEKEVKEIDAADDLGIAKTELLERIAELKEELFEDMYREEDEDASCFFTDRKGKSYEFSLNKKEVEEVFEKHNASEIIRGMLDEMFEETSEVDRKEVTLIQPFGGSSHIDYFLKILTEYFGEDIFDYTDCELEDIYMGIATGAVRFLDYYKDNESNIEIHQSIPFNIGMEKNNIFWPLIKKNTLYGFKTPLKPLPLGNMDLLQKNCRINFYQSFHKWDEKISVSGNDGAVYLGHVMWDSKKCNECAPGQPVLFSIKITEAGMLQISFAVTSQDADTDYEIIDEKQFNIGG